MSWLIGILTVVLVLECLFLILLILVQLPKKEAGMGQAFGGGATDALFGAGSGNALTNLTKYATIVFLVLTLGISVIFGHQNRKKIVDPRSLLTAEEKSTQPLGGAAAKANAAGGTNAAAAAVATAASTISNQVEKAAATPPPAKPAVTAPAPPATPAPTPK